MARGSHYWPRRRTPDRRDDVTVHQQYMADIAASVRATIDTLDPTPTS